MSPQYQGSLATRPLGGPAHGAAGPGTRHAAAVSCSFRLASTAAVPGLRNSSLSESPAGLLAASGEQRELLQ